MGAVKAWSCHAKLYAIHNIKCKLEFVNFWRYAHHIFQPMRLKVAMERCCVHPATIIVACDEAGLSIGGGLIEIEKEFSPTFYYY
jgi:hypothetical protein